MAIKQVELLTTDPQPDILYPKTDSEIVTHGNSTVKDVLDAKVDTIEVDVNATPDKIVKRDATGNINVVNTVSFTDGKIGIGSGNSNGVPYVNEPVHTDSLNQQHQMWTHNTLKVEFGDFTPEARGTTGGTLNTNNAKGQYIRVGNVVTFHLEINLVSVGTAQGNLQIAGLPYLSSANIGKSCSIGWVDGMTAGASFNAYINSGGSAIQIRQRTLATGVARYLTANESVQNQQAGAGNDISISGTYRINA